MSESHSELPSVTTLTPAGIRDRLEPVVQEGKEEQAVATVTELLIASRSSPLPPSAEFAGYEHVTVGAGDRILAMAERQQDAAIALDKSLLHGEFTLKARGQWMAMAALLLMLGVVVLFLLEGQASIGAWLGGGIIVAVVAAFLGHRIIETKSEVPPEE